MRRRGGRLTLVLALAGTLAMSGCWFQYGYDAGHTRHNSVENGLTDANVASLSSRWSVYVSPQLPGEPLVTGKAVVVSTATPDTLGVEALDPATGARIWRHDLVAGMSIGQASPATVIDDGDGDGNVWASWSAVDVGGTCAQGTVRLDAGTGAVRGTEASHMISAPLEIGVTNEPSRIAQVTYTAPCGPTGNGVLQVRGRDSLGTSWRANLVDAPRPETILIAGGGFVFVSDAGEIKGWRIGGCGSGVPVCDVFPVRYAIPGGAVAAASSTDLYVVTGGRLWNHRIDGPSHRWSAATGGRALAVSSSHVFTVGAQFSGAILEVYPATGCGGSTTCSRLWRADLGADTGTSVAPVVAGGVVYVANGSTIQAFDVDGCGSPLCTGRALVTLTAGGPVRSMTVAQGQLFVTTGAGTVEAFAPA